MRVLTFAIVFFRYAVAQTGTSVATVLSRSSAATDSTTPVDSVASAAGSWATANPSEASIYLASFASESPEEASAALGNFFATAEPSVSSQVAAEASKYFPTTTNTDGSVTGGDTIPGLPHLTIIFTPPTQCTDALWTSSASQYGVLSCTRNHTGLCMPPQFNASAGARLFSPGVCPHGRGIGDIFTASASLSITSCVCCPG